MKPHIFLATPCYGGLVTQGYMQSVCALMAAAPGMGLDLTLALLGQDALITRARNSLVSHFAAHPAATHLLFVDADIGFAPEHVLRLLRADKPLVAGLYPLKAYHWDRACEERIAGGEPRDTAGLHYVGRPLPPGEAAWEGDLVTAAHAGTGFMLIARAVIDRLRLAYPQTAYRAVDAYASGVGQLAEAHALFDCAIDPATGTYVSEDFTFCRRWRDIGGAVWLDTGLDLTHTGPSDFRGIPGRRMAPA